MYVCLLARRRVVGPVAAGAVGSLPCACGAEMAVRKLQNVISTPTCGVLIRILVCARGMSRKEAFALLFVTGLLLAGRARAKIASAGSRARTSLRREALNRARLRYRARAFSMVVRSASMTVPRNAPFSRTSRPRMVDPEGEHTSSFNWPGCLPDSSASFAAPSTP